MTVVMYWGQWLVRVAAVLGLVAVAPTWAASTTCEEARFKCGYRMGCGGALNKYLEGCSGVLQGVVSECPEACQHALIILTSTDEGKDLMTCDCSDEFCEDTKKRIDVCRPHVLKALQNDTVMSCTVAKWICEADPQCSTAFSYYNRYCKSMFHGKKCTHRCQNSISILRRQQKAAKLNDCLCDGREVHTCTTVQRNMATLCFHKTGSGVQLQRPEDVGDPETNEVHPTQQRAPNNTNSATTHHFPWIATILLLMVLIT